MTALPRTLEPEVMDTFEEASDYDAMDHAAVNRRFVDDLLSFCGGHRTPGMDRQSRAVDLGTGTALIPLELLAQTDLIGPMIACDLSLQMLKIAVARVARAGQQACVLPVFCDAKCLPVAGASCDIVMSNSIVHHIPNPLDAFREMRRIIRTKGVLFVRDLMRPESEAEVEHFVQTYAGSENAHQQQMFRQSLHAALTVAEVKSLLLESGFSPDWVTSSSDRHWTIAGQI